MALFPRAIYNYNYKFNAQSKPVFFYCGNDKKLHRFLVTQADGTGVENELSFPSSSGITCSLRGKSLEWTDSTKTAFFFVYEQNGMQAIGEYYVGAE